MRRDEQACSRIRFPRGVAADARLGFTLLEMLAVLTIIAIVAALTLPLINRRDNVLALDSAADRLAGALRLTRSAAIARNATLDLTIDAKNGEYGSPAFRSGKLPAGVGVVLDFAHSMRKATNVGGFRFYPNGESSGGAIGLRLGALARRISVDWLTGEAKVE